MNTLYVILYNGLNKIISVKGNILSACRENLLKIRSTILGQVFNVKNEMGVMNTNNAAEDAYATYEELQDNTYQEISPAYTKLSANKKNNNSGKYINMERNQANNLTKVCF